MIRHRIVRTHDGAIVEVVYDGYSTSQAAHDFEHIKYLNQRVTWTRNGTDYKHFEPNHCFPNSHSVQSSYIDTGEAPPPRRERCSGRVR